MSSPLALPPDAYRTFTFNRVANDRSDLHAFVSTSGIHESDLKNIELQTAKAVRFNGFVVLRAITRNATFVWTRTHPIGQRRYVFYFVNNGAVELSGGPGARFVGGHGAGLIYPGTAKIFLRSRIESDFTIFSFDAHAVQPAKLPPDADVDLPPMSPVLWSAAAFLNGLLSTPPASRVQSVNVLRKMTSDIAVGLLNEARKDSADDHLSVRALQIIEANFANPRFTVEDICAQTSLGRRSLERVCAAAGFAPSEALRARRAKNALDLLLSLDSFSVQEIWQPSGFASAESMRRAFLHFYGRTGRELYTESRASLPVVEIDGLMSEGQ